MPASKRIVGASCCCGAAGCPCVDCSGTTPAVQKVTFAGVVADTCEDCSDWNAEHSVPQHPDPDCCCWGGYDEDNQATSQSYAFWPIDIPCEGEVYVHLNQMGADLYIGVDVSENLVLAAVFGKWILGAETTDCENFGVLPRTFGGSPRCDWSASTCSVVGG